MMTTIADLLRLHTNPAPSILFVGEGDFSFSHNLVATLHASNQALSPHTHPTAYDSSKACLKKYGSAATAIQALRSLSCSPSFGVDATSLESTAPRARPSEGYDRVVWMFPHSGEQRVHVNRHLLAAFFKSVGSVLAGGGYVYVTLTDGRPYSDWRLEEAAEASDFKLRRCTSWSSSSLPGYRHVTTLGGSAYGGASGTMETMGLLLSKGELLSDERSESPEYSQRSGVKRGAVRARLDRCWRAKEELFMQHRRSTPRRPLLAEKALYSQRFNARDTSP